MARPSDYSPEAALAICVRLTEGESLRAICRTEGMPHVGTVFRWMEAHPEFREQYARAKDVQADVLADELMEISDDARNDWMERNHGDDDPGWIVNGEHIQRSRLRIDTRKWIASKLKPKKYGEKLELASDPNSPLLVQVVHFADRASPERLEAEGISTPRLERT